MTDGLTSKAFSAVCVGPRVPVGGHPNSLMIILYSSVISEPNMKFWLAIGK